MEVIKIVFYLIGMFFGIENSRVASEKTTVTIDPQNKTIHILSENLFTVIQNDNDSIAVAKELKQIIDNPEDWRSELENYNLKTLEFISDKEGVLNAKMTLKYNNYKDLKDYAVDVNPKGGYSIINVPSWHLKTTDGQLNGNYWNFDASKTFTFTLEPFIDLPEQYISSKTSLYPIWEKITQ